MAFVLKASDLAGEDLVLTVDPDDAFAECDETDNTLTLPPPTCISP